MKFRFRQLWDNLASSLWFLPTVLVLLSMLLAIVAVWIDRQLTNLVPFLGLAPGPQASRDMLSTIASSALTVASVAFSFTIVAFSFASSQYSSRTLHSFMDDRINQIVLGTLLGSFGYCLMVLRTVPLEDNAYVPALSVTVALVLAFVDLGLFILFIHHITESIQAYHIIQKVGAVTGRAVNYLFPEGGSGPSTDSTEVERIRSDVPLREICSTASGYVQVLESDELMRLLCKYDLQIVLHKNVGDFVSKDECLFTAGPSERITDKVASLLRGNFGLGPHRTISQDAQYGILQLADIAIRALSPAINDPNTSVMALNEIGSLLRQVARRELPDYIQRDKEGKVRIVAQGPTFESMAAQAFDQIRRYGMADATVSTKMLNVIGEIAAETSSEVYIDVLRAHALAIIQDANRATSSSRDRHLLAVEIEALRAKLALK
ncbi:MAG: DUF2254 domain-containing protein [Chloroflexota bacterium]|nr:DUF2254 domain-containing protein [Chloroflexota bacterium]